MLGTIPVLRFLLHTRFFDPDLGQPSGNTLEFRKTVEGHCMNRLHAIIPVLFLPLITVQAQTPQSHGKPTEQVVIQYEKLVAQGAFLSPEGWKMAGRIYNQSGAFPRDGEISIMSVGGALGENWVHGDRAEV